VNFVFKFYFILAHALFFMIAVTSSCVTQFRFFTVSAESGTFNAI